MFVCGSGRNLQTVSGLDSTFEELEARLGGGVFPLALSEQEQVITDLTSRQEVFPLVLDYAGQSIPLIAQRDEDVHNEGHVYARSSANQIMSVLA